MQSHAKLLSEVFDDKIVTILKCLLSKDNIFYLRDLSRETNVSLATTYRIIQRLMRLGLVTKNASNKIVYYQLAKNSEVFKELYQVIIGNSTSPLMVLRKRIEEKCGDGANVYAKDKKIFVISNKLKPEALTLICEEIRELIGIKLDALLVSPTQFKQMKSMGLV